ncbi:hypothetical protein D3C80_1840410 [compost metagenome]
MSGQHNRDLFFFVNIYQKFPDLFFRDDIQTDGRFIKKKNARVVKQGRQQVSSHALPQA